MRFISIICLLATVVANAQVKEVNFLGKNWHLHGVDFRIKGRLYSPEFYENLFTNAEFPSQKYESQFEVNSNDVKRDYLRSINTVSAGLVFRPFVQSKSRFIGQMEFAHNVEVEHMTMEIIRTNLENNSLGAFIRTVDIGYQPRFILSSPTIAESLKFYASADGYSFVPLQGVIHLNPSAEFLPNGANNQRIREKSYTDVINTKHFKYGGGLSAGVKMNINCNWNFHLEANVFNVYTRHGAASKTTKTENRGIQFGLRYKFGIPTDGDSVNSDTSQPSAIFW